MLFPRFAPSTLEYCSVQVSACFSPQVAALRSACANAYPRRLADVEHWDCPGPCLSQSKGWIAEPWPELPLANEEKGLQFLHSHTRMPLKYCQDLVIDSLRQLQALRLYLSCSFRTQEGNLSIHCAKPELGPSAGHALPPNSFRSAARNSCNSHRAALAGPGQHPDSLCRPLEPPHAQLVASPPPRTFVSRSSFKSAWKAGSSLNGTDNSLRRDSAVARSARSGDGWRTRVKYSSAAFIIS